MTCLPFGNVACSPYSGGYSSGYGSFKRNGGEEPENFFEGDKLIGFSHFTHSGSGAFELVFLLHFIAYWNDYQTLLIYATFHPTIVYGLFKVMTGAMGTSICEQVSVQMASCTLFTMPVIILFIIFRSKLMGNLTIGGVKE